MAPSERTQNALIAALAVVAVGASGYAVWSVGRPHPSAVSPATAASSTNAPEPAADDAAATSAAPSSTGGTGSAGPATAPPRSADSGVEGWVDAWSGDADLLVVGDGLSNLSSQWVQLWAGVVGEDRPVTIRHWGEAADVSFNDPIVLSDAGGSQLTVWSASRAGTTVHQAAEHYQRFVDASTTPDAVLISLGLHSAGEDIADGLDQLVGEIDEDVPVLVAIGPEDLYEPGVGDALLEWAQENDDRVSVVDLRGEAPDTASAEQWANAFEDALSS